MSWLNDADVKTAEAKQAEAQASMKQSLIGAIQTHLDTTAQERGYDGILSLASYATDPEPTFQSEGQAGVEWRGKVWAYCYAELAAVEAGTRTVPTTAELIAELPAMVWPT